MESLPFFNGNLHILHIGVNSFIQVFSILVIVVGSTGKNLKKLKYACHKMTNSYAVLDLFKKGIDK